MDQLIDKNTWPRREIYDFFSGVSNPHYMVTFRQDVTGVYRFAKRERLSFYYAMVKLVTDAMNSVEAFRYTVRDGKVYLLEKRNPSFTDLRPGEECFYMVTMPDAGTVPEFCREAKRRSEAQNFFIDPEAEGNDLIYISCLPWMDVTAVTNEWNLKDPHLADDAIPRVTWGRYTEERGRKTLCISLEVNHRFVDGLHIGRFAEELTRRIEALDSIVTL